MEVWRRLNEQVFTIYSFNPFHKVIDMFFNCAKFVVSFVISGVIGRILRAVNECLSETKQR